MTSALCTIFCDSITFREKSKCYNYNYGQWNGNENIVFNRNIVQNPNCFWITAEKNKQIYFVSFTQRNVRSTDIKDMTNITMWINIWIFSNVFQSSLIFTCILYLHMLETGMRQLQLLLLHRDWHPQRLLQPLASFPAAAQKLLMLQWRGSRNLRSKKKTTRTQHVLLVWVSWCPQHVLTVSIRKFDEVF